MIIRISQKIAEKLEGRKISEKDICQCFENLEGSYLEDTRSQHKTDPATLWFVATTNKGRFIKIMFITREGCVDIKSAYDATEEIQDIYRKHGC